MVRPWRPHIETEDTSSRKGEQAQIGHKEEGSREGPVSMRSKEKEKLEVLSSLNRLSWLIQPSLTSLKGLGLLK